MAQDKNKFKCVRCGSWTPNSDAVHTAKWDPICPRCAKELSEQDMVNRPNHYAPNGVDSFMHMKDQMGKDAFDGFLQGNAIKYVQRYKFKGKPVEDLCKAAFYLFHLAFEAENPDRHAELYKHLLKTLDHAAKHYDKGAAS